MINLSQNNLLRIYLSMDIKGFEAERVEQLCDPLMFEDADRSAEIVIVRSISLSKVILAGKVVMRSTILII